MGRHCTGGLEGRPWGERGEVELERGGPRARVRPVEILEMRRGLPDLRVPPRGGGRGAARDRRETQL